MPLPPDSAAVLFPGALGDLICFLPTLHGLRNRHAGSLLLVAKSALLDLVALRDMAKTSIDRREIADLFVAGAELAPATRKLLGGCASVYSWTGYGNTNFSQRLAAASGGTVSVYRFRAMRPGEHAADYYARCAGIAPADLPPSIIGADTTWMAAFRQQHHLHDRPLAVIHPGSGSPRKNWRGFTPVMEYWGEHHRDAIVLLSGPADNRTVATAEPGIISVGGLPLPQVAGLLRESTLYLGNDSGISHLAGAVGACGAVLFGATDPRIWAPRSDRLQILHAPEPCGRCRADTFCVHRLPPETVIRVLEAQRHTRLSTAVTVRRPAADGERPRR